MNETQAQAQEDTILYDQTMTFPYAEIVFGKTHEINLTAHFTYNETTEELWVDGIVGNNGKTYNEIADSYPDLLTSGILGNKAQWNKNKRWW